MIVVPYEESTTKIITKNQLARIERAVETTIEQDEQTAIDYLENETQVEDFRNEEVAQ